MSIEEKAMMIYEALIQCFDEESMLPMHMDVKKVEIDFFEAGVLALLTLYHNLTQEELDVIDFIDLLNKAVFQGLMDRSAKEKGESE